MTGVVVKGREIPFARALDTPKRAAASTATASTALPHVRCDCGFDMFDGDVIRSRVVRVRSDARLEAKCRCKRWVRLGMAVQRG